MWLLVIAGLALMGGAALGWVAFFQLRAVQQKVNNLEVKLARLAALDASNRSSSPSANTYSSKSDTSTDGAQPIKPESDDSRISSPNLSFSKAHPLTDSVKTLTTNTSGTNAHATKINTGKAPNILARFKSYWMIILGGVCIGLAGIFMVKYSIDAGLLSPAARIGLAIVTGFFLHGLADWLRRKTGESNPVFAALAGGASITLYAAFLAALHLYQLLPANLVFVLLAVISLSTMALALWHGPVLAIIGLLGGFVVPILLSDGSGNILGALLYSLIITASSLLLMRYVYRSWLWYGMLLGGFGWWWISTTTPLANDWRGLYLAILAYFILAIPRGDLLLQGITTSAKSLNDSTKTPWWDAPITYLFNKALTPVELAVLLLLVSAFWSIVIQPFNAITLWQWIPLTAIVLIVSGSLGNLKYLAWGYLGGQLVSFTASRITWQTDLGYQIQPFQGGSQTGFGQLGFLIFAGIMTLLYMLLGTYNLRKKAYPQLWSSLVFLSPILWLAVSYLLVSDLSQSMQWSTISLLLGLVYLAFAAQRFKRNPSDVPGIWLVFAGHAGYSLAAAMFFREAGLTLVLAVQLISLAALIKHFQLKGVDWLFKLILVVMIARLTFNPWILSYPSEVHWSLWTYGGSTFLAAIACYQLQFYPALRKWLEAAVLHLLVLTLGAETRYWLYDGDIFIQRYSLAEAAINTSLWAALSLCYMFRSRYAQSLQSLYQLISKILLTLAAVSYLISLIWLNPLWSDEIVSSRPIVNLLLLAYGAPVILSWLVMNFHLPAFRRAATLSAGWGLFVFVTIEIRHLWHGELNLYNATGNGELYSYSVVWMLLSGVAILLAYLLKKRQLYRAGIGLLVLVIAKIFLVDMSDLEGLLRVASFMGLGLVLLGLAYLHRVLGFAEIHPVETD